ncbi:gp436 family protein [Photorhabdus antumapuensis]|uniref:gp436 family protein n=1 Tax=Photorhabdus antumapuensis TaxID=2862867 RepID=UPI001CED3BCD|nr:DUF1320 domain-containing protein [Photorhabdus antumapuensis]MCA6221938.1 DUF1320 domain-containing protein [Photorhabdus antumapuensis]
MYCSLADLQGQIPTQSLIWLSNEEPNAQTINATVVNSVIRYADELIDSHLRGRYILPLAEVPTVLRDAAITLTRYRLYARRPEGSIPEAVIDDYKIVLRQLADIRDAKLTLGLLSTGKDAPEPGEFRVRARCPTFGGRQGMLEKY